jgi:hypothetical protein
MSGTGRVTGAIASHLGLLGAWYLLRACKIVGMSRDR